MTEIKEDDKDFQDYVIYPTKIYEFDNPLSKMALLRQVKKDTDTKEFCTAAKALFEAFSTKDYLIKWGRISTSWVNP